jgi:hypothetical protein
MVCSVTQPIQVVHCRLKSNGDKDRYLRYMTHGKGSVNYFRPRHVGEYAIARDVVGVEERGSVSMGTSMGERFLQAFRSGQQLLNCRQACRCVLLFGRKNGVDPNGGLLDVVVPSRNEEHVMDM